MWELLRPVASENAPVKNDTRKPPSNLPTKQQNVESQLGNIWLTNA